MKATPEEQQDKINTIIEHVEEKFEDLPSLILEKYYAKYPEAVEIFKSHAFGDVKELEQAMIDSLIHCSMIWYAKPREVQDILETAVPQHKFLKINMSLFSGLAVTFFDFITDLIKSLEASLILAWSMLRKDFLAFIAELSE